MNTVQLIQLAKNAGVKLRLANGKIKVTGKFDAVQTQIELLRPHKADLIQWFTQAQAIQLTQWLELDRAYQRHHFACPTCIAAGQGRGLRCGLGAAMWLGNSI